MPMRSGLSVYCFVPPTSTRQSASVSEIGSLVSSLAFGSAAPGGYTMLEAVMPLRDVRLQRPEFAMFSLIAVMSGPRPIWLGEITDPEIGMDETFGEYLRISALGLGNGLRDFPSIYVFTNQTAKQIASIALQDWTSAAAPFLNTALQTVSPDTALIFPDNPAPTYTTTYDNKNIEEVVADVCILAGDYQWGVWAHGSQKNAAGFPLGQLSVQKRDAATTHYSASVATHDVSRYTVTPSAERAYNAISVHYPTPTGPIEAFALDPRLDPVFDAQKDAPFRYREMVRDYSSIPTMTSAMATAIANTYLAQHKDPTNKIALTLRQVRDAGGQIIPLWDVAADRNIFIRDFAPRGVAPMPTVPTAGVNQFYIVSAEYREDQNTQTLELQCDNFVDRVAHQIARLTLAADAKSRTNRTTGFVQSSGVPASGNVVIGQSNALNGGVCIGGIQYPNALYRAPTSIAFTTITTVGLAGIAAANMTTVGALVTANSSVNGNVKGEWTYTTSGNCIRRVGRKLFDWHCDGCDKEFKGLALARYVRIETALGTRPGDVALAIDCPECGRGGAGEQPFTESFNTGLTSSDEEPIGRHTRHPHRREQARLIRQLMKSGAVGLEILP